MLTTQPTKPNRIELILRQIDSLPTLPAIATRLLSLTASDESHAREVIELVRADPPLTAKVLSLCRSADRGLRDQALTVDRAVVLLGFSAIRNAALSVKVFEMFGGDVAREPAHAVDPSANRLRQPRTAGADGESGAVFDRVAFWHHSLAVAVLAESIATQHPGDSRLKADEAFVCGLLHDVGKLALDHVLPRSFARVVELTDLNQGNIGEFERRIVGIDHHTAGKRLAQQWGLPHRLIDCIWLHGSNYDTLPRLEHRRLVGLIGLADLLARQQHVGYSGNYRITQNADELIQKLELRPAAVRAAVAGLHEALEQHGRALGLHDQPSRELFLDSIQRANETLGRLNHAMEVRSRTAASQGRILEAICAFHAAAVPGQGAADVLDAVVHSARKAFGKGFYAMLLPTDPHTGDRDTWMISQYGSEGEAARSQCIEAPPYTPDLSELDMQQPMAMSMMGILPWIADYLIEAEDLRAVRLLPLNSGWGTAAVLLHDRADLPPWQQLAALTGTWGGAIAGAGQHDGARRLGEELAEANTALAEAQDRLLRHESMARLGEMAAGAAHEMNNPLAIIAGRSQLLSMTLPAGSKQQQAAQTVFREAHRLSDLITTLRTFAEPPQPVRVLTELPRVLDEAIRKVQGSQVAERDRPDITLRVRQELPKMELDREQLREAIQELLFNAVQAGPCRSIQVVAQIEPGRRAVVVQVIDDGPGMDQYTLDHAMDPFFSAKAAGRRCGMGLPRAQRIIASHGGQLELRSALGEGCTATLTLPLDAGDELE